MAKIVTPNYTEAQEQRIRDSAPHNLATATDLATEMGKTPRSLIAKMVRMGVTYATKQPVTKSGEPVVSKTDLVASIASVVTGNLEGLEKAPKAALQALARYVLH